MTEVKRNRLLLFMCFLIYSVSYIGKYSYSTNIQNVITDLQISKAYAGYVTSAFFFCYGIGQLFNGILCEKFDSKCTIALSLCVSAIITFTMFFLKNIVIMAVLWGINGLILSTLWSHCVKMLATIQDQSYIEKSVTVMSLCLPVGVVLSYGFSAFFTYINFWKFVYPFAAILLGVAGVSFFLMVGKIERDVGELKENIAKEVKTQNGGTIVQLFGWIVVPLIIICIATGLVRDGASTWLPVILKDTYNMPDSFSILLTVGVPLMGVFAATMATYFMNKTKNLFVTVILVGIACMVTLGALIFTFEGSVILLIVLFMLVSLGGYILGNVLTSVLPLYYKAELKSGQAAGVINACVYIGSTLSSFALGGIVDNHGWRAFMIVLFVTACTLITMALFGILNKSNSDRKG